MTPPEMIGFSRLWNALSVGQEDDSEPSADSKSDPSNNDQSEQDDETIELSVTVEQLTISSGDET